MTDAEIISGATHIGNAQGWAGYIKFRRPDYLEGPSFGFLFRIISAILAGFVALVVSALIGAFNGWQMSGTLKLIDGFIIVAMVLMGEHFRSRVFERIAVDGENAPDVAASANTQRQKSASFQLRRASVRRKYHPVLLGGKRLFDIFSAALALVVFGPLMLTVAALVRFESPGPIFFFQQRLGPGNKRFVLYKFRTIAVSVPSDSPATSLFSGDARVTRAGAFLRRTGLDELPQLFNVLKGDMSLVGPGPRSPSWPVDRDPSLEEAADRGFKPGLTGFAQLNDCGGPAETNEHLDRTVEHDLYYLENWSMLLDFWILARTVYRGFIGKNKF